MVNKKCVLLPTKTCQSLYEKSRTPSRRSQCSFNPTFRLGWPIPACSGLYCSSEWSSVISLPVSLLLLNTSLQTGRSAMILTVLCRLKATDTIDIKRPHTHGNRNSQLNGFVLELFSSSCHYFNAMSDLVLIIKTVAHSQ